MDGDERMERIRRVAQARGIERKRHVHTAAAIPLYGGDVELAGRRGRADGKLLRVDGVAFAEAEDHALLDVARLEGHRERPVGVQLVAAIVNRTVALGVDGGVRATVRTLYGDVACVGTGGIGAVVAGEHARAGPLATLTSICESESASFHTRTSS